MKSMKQYIIALAASAMMLSACNDWLDVEPSTEMDQSSLFSNEAGFADAITGIYANMIDHKLYGGNLSWSLLEMLGGGASYTWGFYGDVAQTTWLTDAEWYNQSFREENIDAIWNQMYNTIANCNAIIAEIDNHQDVFTGDDYQIMKGEVYGLRAFLHFDLLRLFGGYPGSKLDGKPFMPYVMAFSSDVAPLLTSEEVSELAIRDLEEAVKLMENDPIHIGTTPDEYLASAVQGYYSYRDQYGIANYHNRRLHFNYYTALATLARVYLWKGDKVNALRYAKMVIDDQPTRFPWTNPTLISNISSSYASCKDRTFSNEHIFALHIRDINDRTDGYLWEGAYSFGSGSRAMNAVNINCFDANGKAYDPRYRYLLTTSTVQGSEVHLSNKLWDDGSDEHGSPWAERRLPLMRVSEMYYIAAECEPNLEKATEYLETVRAQRGLSSFPLDCKSAGELESQIEIEYTREFISEGQLYHYRKRKAKTFSISSMYSSFVIQPSQLILPRPDQEDTYGGRK